MVIMRDYLIKTETAHNAVLGYEGENNARTLRIKTVDDISEFATINLLIGSLDCGPMRVISIYNYKLLEMVITEDMLGEAGLKMCQLVMRDEEGEVVLKTNQFCMFVNSSNYADRVYIATEDVIKAAVEALIDEGKMEEYTIPDNSISGAKIIDNVITMNKLAQDVIQYIISSGNSNHYICHITGSASGGFSYVSGSSYQGLTDALTRKLPAYIQYGADARTYHLIYAVSGTMAFASVTGATLELFTINASGIELSQIQLVTSTALTSAINNALSVYDTMGLRTDIFQYAKGRADSLKDEHITPIVNEIHNAYSVNDDGDTVTYATLGQTLNGILSIAKAYTRARLVEYRAFRIDVVDELPVAGESMVFYLVPKDNGGYDKYWWITDENDNPTWDVFGSATTLVVSSLPQTGDEDTDYILKTSSGCLYYKYIDGEWEMVAGSLAEVVEELPQTGNEYTDYYCQNESGTYVHYKWIDGDWAVIGSDSYTKDEVDTLVSAIGSRIGTLEGTLNTAQSNLSQVSRTVDRLAQDLANLDTEGVTYYAALSQTEQGAYIYTLYEVDGEDETVKSQFTLPSGGGGGPASTTELVVERITASPVVVTPTDSVSIGITYSSMDGDGELVDGTYSWKVGSTTVMTGNLVQGLNTFDLTEFCSVGTQKLILTVTDEGGSTVVKSWTVQIVDVRLESAFSDRYTNPIGRSVNFTYTPHGAIAKTVHFKLDGQTLESVVTTASGTLQSYTIAPQTHGAHLLECWITATVSNSQVETAHIFKDIIWYDEGETDPVIGCLYRYDYYGVLDSRQYDTIRIPYVVYDPNSSAPTVTLAVDGVTQSTLRITESYNVWAFKSDDVAVHVLTITCGETTVELRVDVAELGYDVSPVTANMAFDFNPTGLSNSSSDRLWHDADNPSVAMTVSENFDWNNGGYQIDDEGNQYFCVKAGSRAYFSYNLFGIDPKQAGSEFKIIFKTTGVRDKDATFLTCLTGTNGDGAGLKMQTHLATFYTSSDTLEQPYSEEDVIEFEYNILAIDIEDSNATSFVMTYEDGVGCRPLIYPNDDGYRLYQLSPVPITIGSDDCDVWIYRMKAYESALTDSDVLKNFIADARDSSTMISRYERNQIYNENNVLTPESVADSCPDLKIIKLSCPYFTNDKKDYVKNTSVECIHRNGDPALDNWTYTNGYHVGQGTTSNRYGLAGRNIDIIFGCTGLTPVVPPKSEPFDPEYISVLTLGDGTRYPDGTGAITLTRDSVPNTWFNIKVNIASSENANNALLQKRYNDFIPYKTPGQKRDGRVKNSMEFVNCVVFVRETDPDISKHREFADTAWHFYAIGNLGDSKKTDNTRVNDPEDMREHVVEVSDNTLPNSYFDTGVYYDENGDITYDPTEAVLNEELDIPSYIVYPITQEQWENPSNLKRAALYDGWDDSFEFRYDMGTKDGETITDEMTEQQQEESKQVFRDMYEFVVTSSDADFVAHFGDWFVTESYLYWYLFTERYTMTDNRAKNSFWHWGKTYISESEAAEMGDDAQYYTINNTAAAINDGYRYDLWDYDNDTALGIDNNGELKMTYGKEDTDYKTDGDPSSGYIFNAADSVIWRRIRQLMGTQLRAMYQSRESLNCWSASSLIAEFDAWQEQFPEELWRLDIERKYKRPYYSGNPVAGISPSRDFLENMCNGRKRYQRRQFERNQEIYIGTKYFGTNQCADTRAISFRCNTPQSAIVRPDYTLRVVPYSDMYLWVNYGNSTPQGVRAKAGQEYIFTTAMTVMDDTMVLIYCAENIQAINDLSACYIRANDFSVAKRLKTLIIGSDVEGYSNPFITTLNIKDNELLETLDIRNCENLTGSLNFSGCPNLLTLLAEGTAVTGVTFARNGKIQTAHLPETINSLTLNNLYHLTDLELASYDNLITFVSEYSDVDELSIIDTAISTLQIIRVLGLDWVLSDTGLLNEILGKSQTRLAGDVYISGPIRNKELDNYEETWPDLSVTYDSEKLVTQYAVTFANSDGTTLYEDYVDRGSAPVDPVVAGYISTPVRASDDQYTYTFSGWDNIENDVLAPVTITAQYTSSIRTYTVRWFSRPGLLLETQTKAYGAEAVYSGSLPTNETEEASYIYNLFAGWDKSTGYITGDIDVYAVWERAELPLVGTELHEMTRAEIFAVHKAGLGATYFEDKDHFDMTLGWDFDFSNVESQVLLENRFFDGTQYYDTNIKLFDADAEDFTIAVEYEFLSTNVANSTLMSCFSEYGSEGMRLRYSGHPYIQWGDREYKVGVDDERCMLVLRHLKGSSHLFVHCGDVTSAHVYDLTAVATELVRTRNTQFDGRLSFGAVRFESDSGHDYHAKGWIYWAKIWYADLGVDVANKLACWTHDRLRMEFSGAERYRIAGTTSQKADGSYVANNLLPKLRRMNATNINTGGWNGSEMRGFLNTRVWAAFDYGWKSMIPKVKVTASAGSMSSEILISEDWIFLSATREMGGSTAVPYSNEGTAISWYTSNSARLKFTDIIREADEQVITEPTDPTLMSGYTVKAGDIWVNTSNSSYGYVYIPADVIAKHTTIGCSKVSGGGNIPASDGGLWYRTYVYWLRSPEAAGAERFSYVSIGGYIGANISYYTGALSLGFAII